VKPFRGDTSSVREPRQVEWSAAALDVQDVTAGYGGADILSAVTLHGAAGRIATIAGPNGAGKSTLIKTLAGLVRPRQGRILIGTRDVTGLPPAERAGARLGYVFRNLTIAENLLIGFEFIRPDASRRDFHAARDRVLDLFPDLKPRLWALAGTLSGGQRQMLAMSCSPISKPSVLLLDDPSPGL